MIMIMQGKKGRKVGWHTIKDGQMVSYAILSMSSFTISRVHKVRGNLNCKEFFVTTVLNVRHSLVASSFKGLPERGVAIALSFSFFAR